MFHSPFYLLRVVFSAAASVVSSAAASVVSSAAARILSAVISGGFYRCFLLLFCFVLCRSELRFDLCGGFLQSLSEFFRVEVHLHNAQNGFFFLRNFRTSSFFPVIVSLINRCGTSQFTAFITVSYCAACFTSAKNCENFTSVLSSFANASTKLILLDLLFFG